MAGGKAGKILNDALGVVNPVAGIIQGAGQIFNAVGNHQEDLGLRKNAATQQSQVEQAAFRIQDMVNSGEMDVDAGLAALDQLDKTITSMAGQNSQMANGAGTAKVNIANVRANLQTRRTQSLNYSAAPNGEPGNLTGSPSTQLNKLGTNIRNYFIGAPQGGNIAGSPIGDLMKPVQAPGDRLKELGPQFDAQFPSIIKPPTKRKEVLY